MSEPITTNESCLAFWQRKGYLQVGDKCPMCDTGTLGISADHLRCANCGYLGRQIESEPRGLRAP